MAPSTKAFEPEKYFQTEDALALFGLVNFIILKAISEPKQIAAIYGRLLANKVDGINQRDGKNVVPETS